MSEIVLSHKGICHKDISGMKELAGDIFALEKISFKHPWTIDNISAELSKETSLCMASFYGDEMAAACCFSRTLDEAELLRICVSPEHRREGLASVLLDLALKNLATIGVTSVFLEVRKTNGPAIALYKKHGFCTISERKNYYGDCDALVMKRNM